MDLVEEYGHSFWYHAEPE